MKTIFLGFNIANSSVSDYFLELSKQLSEEFQIVILSNKFDKDKFKISSNIEVVNWPEGNPATLESYILLYQKIKEYNPDTLISVFGAVNPFLILGYALGVKNRIAWCRSISKQFKVKPWRLKRKKYIYDFATIMYANSYSTKKDLIENYGVEESKIAVYYNAVKMYSLKQSSVQQKKLVYAGRMSYSKGIDTLLDSMPLILVKFPQTQLILIGGILEGNEIQIYKEKCKKLLIEENVLFVGNKSKQYVLQEFCNAYLTIVPSLVEAFGFVVIESFSVKTPVVGSNTSGIAEIIRNKEDGLLFEPGDSRDLAVKIIYLLENEPLRNDLSINCFERFKEHFELEGSIGRLKDEIIRMNN